MVESTTESTEQTPENQPTSAVPTESKPKVSRKPMTGKPKPATKKIVSKAKRSHQKKTSARKPSKKARSVKASKKVARTSKSGETVVRFSATFALLKQLHGAERRLKLASLTALIKRALADYLTRAGEKDVAAAIVASDRRGLATVQTGKPIPKRKSKKA